MVLFIVNWDIEMNVRFAVFTMGAVFAGGAASSCGNPAGPNLAPFTGTWVLVSHYQHSLPAPFLPTAEFPLLIADTIVIGLAGPTPVTRHLLSLA